jgi:outer membrane protein
MKVKTCLMLALFAFALFFMLPLVSSQAEEKQSPAVRTLTLEECISIALEHNADAVIAEKNVQSSAAGVRGAVANFLPQLDARSSYSHSVQSFQDPLSGITVEGVDIPERYLERRSDSYSASLSLSQSLYRGGYNLGNLAYARAGHQRAKDSREQIEQSLALEVKVRYYDLLKASRLLQVAEELVRSSEEQVKLEESLYEIGATAKTNLLRAKVKLGEDRLSLISAGNDLSIAKANLNDILGLHLDTPVEVVDNLTVERATLDLAALIEEAISRHPSVRVAEAQRQQARASLGMAKSGRMPVLSASGNYSWGDSDLPEDMSDWKDHDSWSVGLSLSIPVFDGFATKANIHQAQLNMFVVEEELSQAKRDVSLAVKQAFLNVTEAEERIQVTEESLALAEEERRLAEERYRLGASFLLELIDSQVAFTTAQTNYISALYDYQLALAQLKQAVGKPVLP